MRLRKPVVSSPAGASSSLSSSSSSASPSSSFQSSINNHSLASSSIDSSYSLPNASSDSTVRCEGLDLLVKAIHQVTAGSSVGVPYVQRRVIRRRRASLRFSKLVVVIPEDGELLFGKQEDDGSKNFERQRRAAVALPSKYQDSVLQPWKHRSRRQPPGRTIGAEMDS